MTTFQDPPPQSRRAVRQSERGEVPSQASEQASDTEQVRDTERTDTEARDSEQTRPYSFDSGVQLSTAAQDAPQVQDAPHVSGRRAQLPQAASVVPLQFDSVQGFEPLTYVTQARPPASTTGSIETPELPSQLSPSSDAHSRQPSSDRLPQEPQHPSYRERDFSPEGRRAAISREQFSAATQAPPAQTPLAPPTTAPVDLDHVTAGSPAVHSHAATPQRSDDSPANHTLTRRELRELRAAQDEPPALRLPEPIDALLNSGPIDIPVLSAVPGQSQALADAMAEFDALTRGRRETRAASAAETRVVDRPTGQSPVETTAEDPSPPVLSVPVSSVPVSSVPVVSASIPLPVTPIPWPAPAAAFAVPIPEVVSNAVPEAVPLVEETEPHEMASADPIFIEPERTPSTRPVGHWSVQAQIDDEEQPEDSRISRTVGSGSVAITTSALVMPSVPQSSDFTSPFSSTGEILVTGSIDLPRSLSSTGAHPHRIDNSDFEDDPLDSEVPTTDSAPVRAIRAISTHTSTRGVIESKRPQTNRMPTVMIIAASVLAVGVVGLLVAAAVMHLFG